MKKWLKIIFFSQILLFILVILFLFTPLNEISTISAMIFFILFSLIGIVSVFLVKRNMEKGKLKRLLIINGLSAFGVMFFSVVHNLFYALNEISGRTIFVKLLEFLEGTFFILGVLISPIVFLVTMVLIVIELSKKKE
jgi:hypothetical protein